MAVLGSAADMNKVDLAHAPLAGWRARVADAVAAPIARRSRIDERTIQGIVGAVFFALATSYVTRTVLRAVRSARA